MRGSSFSRRNATFLPALSALTLAGCVSIPERSESPNLSVQIGTYNLYTDFVGDQWDKRKQHVLAFVSRSEFDILALQEVTEIQIADLAARITDLNFVLGARSDGHRADQSWYEYNPIFYSKSRYELIGWSSFWVSETPDVPGSILPGTKRHARVLNWAKLKDRSNGLELLVVNVHIHGLRAQREIEIILAEIARLNHPGPIVLLGDFNMRPDQSTHLKLVTGEFGFDFVDTFENATTVTGPLNSTVIGPNGATYDNDGSMRYVKESIRIDYIFVCGDSAVGEFATHPNEIAKGIYASDHFALSTAIQIQGPCKRQAQ